MGSLFSKEEKKDFSIKSHELNTIEKCNFCGIENNCLIKDQRFDMICYTCNLKMICWQI